MYVGLKQPRGDGERYVTPARAAAKETNGRPNCRNIDASSNFSSLVCMGPHIFASALFSRSAFLT